MTDPMPADLTVKDEPALRDEARRWVRKKRDLYTRLAVYAAAWRSMLELLWRLAGSCPSVVLEANFRSRSPYERERLLALSSRPIEVYCRVPIPVAARRYALRGASASHHPVHVARTLPVEAFHEFKDPFGIGPVIEVDTTREVDIEVLAVEVSLALRS
jgi:hypothetical protein